MESSIYQPHIIGSEDIQGYIDRVWQSSTGRESTDAKLGMFVAVGEDNVEFDRLAENVLTELYDKPELGFRWAQDWGRTIAAVHPIKRGVVELGSTNDRGTRSYVAIESTKLLRPQDVFIPTDLYKHTILLNEQPTTLEGLVVEVVHLIDEAVWHKVQSDGRSGPEFFKLAVEELLHNGLGLRFASTGEILGLTERFASKSSVRLYGSEVIGSVPKVMGGVVTLDTVNRSTNNFGSKKTTLPETKDLAVPLGEGSSFGLDITLAKPLHAGHLLNIGLAEMGRAAACGSELVLMSNDTAPRLAGALLQLAQTKEAPIYSVADSLRRGVIKASDLTNAYRSRDTAFELKGKFEALSEIEKGGLLKTLEDDAVDLIRRMGFGALHLVRESNLASTVQEVVREHQLRWGNIGFAVSRAGQKMYILEKQGRITHAAKVAAFLLDACRRVDSMCIVDNGTDSFQAAEIAQTLGYKAEQLGGVGISINGRIGSGTEGTLPDAKELFDHFGADLGSLILFFNLTQPLTSKERPNGRTTDTVFDFASRESLFTLLEKTQKELDVFMENLRRSLKVLNASSGNETLTANKGDRAFLDNLASGNEEVSSQVIVMEMRKLKPIKENTMFESCVRKWERRWGGSWRRDLVAFLESGQVRTNIDVMRILSASGVLGGSEILPNELDINSTYLDVVRRQGYSGEEAVNRVLDYQEGRVKLSARSNPYFKTIQRITQIVDRTSSWSRSDAENTKLKLLSSIERLGLIL